MTHDASNDETTRHSRQRYTNETFSSFYRSYFGSVSPDEYMNLRISCIDKNLDRDEIKQMLTYEFAKFAPFEVKVHYPGKDYRLAYINFEQEGTAKRIRHTKLDRLRELLGSQIIVDPTGVLRDQDGKFTPDRFHRSIHYKNASHSPKMRNKLMENDLDATPTLFIGNLPSDITKFELQEVFGQYGVINEIDIKRLDNLDGAYAFVKYLTTDSAIAAKHGEYDNSIRPNTTPCNIGYGREKVSRCLWINGLGPWCSLEMLKKECYRFGIFDKIEYEPKNDSAYVSFNNAIASAKAIQTWRAHGFNGHEIQAIYANNKKSTNSLSRKRACDYFNVVAKRQFSPPLVGKVVYTFDDLQEHYTSTWIGNISLKQCECKMRMHRIAGAEKHLQTFLRDSDGNSVTIPINLRVSFLNHSNITKELMEASSEFISVMIGVGKEADQIEPIVNYLKEKGSVGYADFSDAIMYIFPPSGAALEIIKRFAPSVHLPLKSSYLLCLLGVVDKINE